ncbi:hypothetical protein RSPO_c02360 [Ralstonia solanacearum Po82]|uniref:Uncharacterized protein n=1 Tax=Ralstonia solanacearum (strain Po82) TaxID=1031711 RepID=F6G2H2_RALS8|nr:hypothetical protein RSPO_c02360 [Ralstonia solanacearum Po82]
MGCCGRHAASGWQGCRRRMRGAAQGVIVPNARSRRPKNPCGTEAKSACRCGTNDRWAGALHYTIGCNRCRCPHLPGACESLQRLFAPTPKPP